MSLLLAAATLTIFLAGQAFTCTPTSVWDGDHSVWPAEGPKIRLSAFRCGRRTAPTAWTNRFPRRMQKRHVTLWCFQWANRSADRRKTMCPRAGPCYALRGGKQHIGAHSSSVRVAERRRPQLCNVEQRARPSMGSLLAVS